MAQKNQSGSFTSTLPGGNPLYFKVQTTYQTDQGGNPIPGSQTHTLLYNPGNGTYYPAATTNNFRTFDLKKYTPAEIANAGITQYAQPDGTVLGPTAAKSLQTYGGVINSNMRGAVASTSINNGLTPIQSQTVQGVPQNASTTLTPSDSPQGGNQPPPLPTTTIDSLNLLSGKPLPGRPIKENYGTDMRYPQLMENMDVIKFTAIQYGGRGFAKDLIGFSETRNLGKSLGVATLGIQPSITDNNTVNWSGLEMNLLETTFSEAGLSFMEKGAEGFKSSIDKAINSLNMEEGAKQALLTLIAQEGASTKGLLSRLTGAISNPNLELLFQGPQLRTFNFNFSFSPRRDAESVMVKRIINFFKRNMSVQRSKTNLFLKAPNVFNIEYLYVDKKVRGEHQGLNKIKTCALLNCSVDYTPTGSYMTFNDPETQSMVSYNISLTFQELEPVYEDEYEGHPIGY
jgi:hypothetical protein